MDKTEVAIEKMLDGKDEYIAEVFFTLRQNILESDSRITETIKWGMPSYEYKGIICGVGAFKNYVSIWFHKGQLMSNNLNLFVNGEGNKSMGQIKVGSLAGINSNDILEYIKEGIQLNEKGLHKLSSNSKRKLLPKSTNAQLLDALKKHTKAQNFFNSLTEAQKSAFCLYINEAKQEATIEKRIERSIDRLEQGFNTYY